MKIKRRILHFLVAGEMFMMQGLPVAAASAGVQPASVNKTNAVIAAVAAMLSGIFVYIVRHSSK